ncbi:MAG: response regulator [Tepidisphaeraceae bacterium]
MTILVVDEDPGATRVLQDVLGRAGYDVAIAFDGESALRRLRRGDIRVVVAARDMQNMTGLELCRQIRTDEAKRYTYFIMTSADASEGVVAEALAGGADDFVRKPCNTSELLLRVRTATRVVSMETLDMTIFAMAKLAEMRDSVTGRHVERVARYSRALARQLSRSSGFEGVVTQEYVSLIYQTAPLHDIGKVAIPDAVLMKSTPLSPEEFALMKTHTTLGAGTLDAAIREYPDTPFLLMARDIAATHHERWDGSGYPRGLSGTDIPLAGRIVALSDVYDALTSNRPYKPAIEHLEVKRMIVEASGTHFDPDVVNAFLACEMEFVRILAEFGDRAVQPTVATALAA